MKPTNKNMVKWELDNIVSLIEKENYDAFSLIKLEKAINNLIKTPQKASEYLPKLDDISVKLARAFEKIQSRKVSVRDEVLCGSILLNSVLNKMNRVADMITMVEHKSIQHINHKFVLNKAYSFFEKGKKLQNNKIWGRLVRAYKKGEISATRGVSKKIQKSLKQKKKGFFAKLLEMLGL